MLLTEFIPTLNNPTPDTLQCSTHSLDDADTPVPLRKSTPRRTRRRKPLKTIRIRTPSPLPLPLDLPPCDSVDDAELTETDEQLVNDHNHVGPGHDVHARPHICNYADCDKAFARKSDLARHFRIHTNDRPFTCSYRGCGKAFIQRSALTVHFRTHTGEKPHHCENERCLKSFADSSSLARHRRIHTGMRPYSCPVPGCGKPFARRNTLLKHFKRTHPDLPPPSTSSQRASIHGPVLGSRASSGSFLSSGSIGSNGEYYIATPSSNGPPHGFATLHPPGGTAYPFSGGFHGSVFGGASGPHPTLIIPSNGNIKPQLQQSPQSQGGHSLTPISTASSYLEPAHQFSDNQTPSPSGGGLTPSETKSQAQTHGQAGTQGGAQIGFSPSPATSANSFGFPQYPSPLSAYPQAGYPLARFPSDGSGVIYTDKQAISMNQRSVSNPIDAPRFQPYMSGPWGHVGGGFHPSQLAIPQGQQHLMPSYYHSMSQAIHHPGQMEEKPYIPHSPTGSTDDEGDEPLVALHEAPMIALHPPNGPAMNVPFSAVESTPYGQPLLSQSQVLVVNQQNQRLHSAPPTMQRFNSLPAVPTMSQWASAGQYESHSAGDDQSADEEWEDLENEMISREGSASVADESHLGGAVHTKKRSASGDDVPQWGQPIQYPIPPRENQKNPFSSAASSSSTASTLVASSIHTAGGPAHSLPPISVYTQHPQPMALTPINPNGYYPTPITPANGWMQEQMKSHVMLQSPAHLQHHDHNDQENDTSQDITLTTPPKWGERKDGRTVSAVGLGIANVHFDDRQSEIEAGKEYIQSDREWAEGEDDVVSEDDTVEDGSDDEYVLGRKPKKARRSIGSKARGGAKATARKGRKSAVF